MRAHAAIRTMYLSSQTNQPTNDPRTRVPQLLVPVKDVRHRAPHQQEVEQLFFPHKCMYACGQSRCLFLVFVSRTLR